MSSSKYYNNKLISKTFGKLWYHEELYDTEYIYVIRAKWQKNILDIIITFSGVSLDFINSGDLSVTNICPEGMFGMRQSLKKKHLNKILDLVVATDGEGKIYNSDEREEMHEKFVREEMDDEFEE